MNAKLEDRITNIAGTTIAVAIMGTGIYYGTRGELDQSTAMAGAACWAAMTTFFTGLACLPDGDPFGPEMDPVDDCPVNVVLGGITGVGMGALGYAIGHYGKSTLEPVVQYLTQFF
jgi:hypothetical protein